MSKIQQHFHDALVTGIRKRIIPNKTKESRDWYREVAKEITSANRSKFIKDQDPAIRQRHTPNKGLEIGSMYTFNYDPKWKKELPIYDTFPLIFPFHIESDRFLGLNMHYLPPAGRAQLMDVLYTITNNTKYNHSTKLKLSYQVLKNIAKKEAYAPTIHMYLKKHVKSKLRWIAPVEWDYTLMLPLAKWNGPDKEKYRGF